MENKTYHTIDKSSWGPGPWQSEPDKVQWAGPETNYPCIAVRQRHSGHWCGYVGVEPDHPAFGKGYDDLDCTVHGGLTYADSCQADRPEEIAVCHVPAPGEPDNIWWLGFDCAHADDLMPKYYAMGYGSSGTYRTLQYVQDECRNLAKQLKAMEA